jgi:hypothetical protein
MGVADHKEAAGISKKYCIQYSLSSFGQGFLLFGRMVVGASYIVHKQASS